MRRGPVATGRNRGAAEPGGDRPRAAAGAPVAMRPRKRFGQHFLAQPAIASRIVEVAALDGAETVLEIGPGRGALTRRLAESGRRLFLIEIDRDLARQLREGFAGHAEVQVVEGNVLDVDLPALLAAHAPVAVVANLPYNISTPVLMQLLDAPELFSRLVLMLQREVAERLCAEPGTKAYGSLTVAVQAVAQVRIALRVPPTAFVPRPKVESAVVVVEPVTPPPLATAERRLLRTVVRTAFSRRRKQLHNVLAPLTPHPHAVLEALGLDARRRPETLTPADFVRLSRALKGDDPAAR